MYKILITNDDGIDSDGIIRLAKTAMKYGEVWVVAPESERSCMSHSITLRHSFDVWEYDFPVAGVHAYACDGTPADCVRIGILSIVPGKPDYVFSGINYGYNTATDLQYSATAGAALEAAFQNVRAIAFSEEAVDCHQVTDKYLSKIMGELMEKPLDSRQIWNVNFPGCNEAECKGILYDRIVSEDSFYKDRYKELSREGNRVTFMVDGLLQSSAEEGTDLHAVLNKYVSVGIVNNLK